MQPNPTYNNIQDHTESIRIEFDPRIVPYESLLALFWKYVPFFSFCSLPVSPFTLDPLVYDIRRA
jgi:hypothetical protein